MELGEGLGEVFGQDRPQLLGHSFELQLSDEAEQVFLEELAVGAMFFVIDQVALILLDGCLTLWLFWLDFAVDLSEEVLDELLLQVGDFEAVAQLEQSFVELETDPAPGLPVEEVPLFGLRDSHVQVVIALYPKDLNCPDLRDITIFFLFIVAVAIAISRLGDLKQRVNGN